MTRRGTEIEINDFSGGLHTATAVTEVARNEAYDASNIVIGPGGSYIRSRYGNTTFNGTAMNSSADVQGLAYLKLINGNDFLVAVCGDKVFKADALDGTMDDITGAVTVTAGQDNIWTLLTFNNVLLMFGGSATNPDTPLQWTGAGNAAALTGTPPAAYGAVQANNRVFAFRTAASPSIVQWCILGNPQDWTGTGSGSQTISTSDNDSVTACAVMNNSLMLVFKQNSVHKMLISTLVSTAFPVFPLFQNVGCAGKHALVVADGLCYFITPKGKMKITNGEIISDDVALPRLEYIADLWSGGNSSRLQYVQGRRLVGPDYDHICWIMTAAAAGTEHDTALIWDIKNKCWLRHKTGYKANVITTTQTGDIYTGDFAGVIYKQDVVTATTDASVSSTPVDSYWSSGWDQFGSLQKNKAIIESYLSFVSQTSGNINFSWGYGFNAFQKTAVIDQRVSGGIIGQFIIGIGLIGGQTDFIKRIFTTGNGSVFQYRIRCNDFKMKINRLTLIGSKISGS